MAGNTIRNDKVSVAEQQEIESQLSKNLVDFVHNDTVYSVKRLLPADLKVAYVGRNYGYVEDVKNPLDAEFEPSMHPEKGGMLLTENVNYNCLVDQGDEGNAMDLISWKCPLCQVNRLSHYSFKCS